MTATIQHNLIGKSSAISKAIEFACRGTSAGTLEKILSRGS